MTFTKESEFEEALIKALTQKGWENEVIKHPSEEDLLRNWADILFENNRGIDRLNDHPLTDSEMQQLVEQITTLRTPLKLNGFINGKTVSITRDNPADTLHYGKEISLKIYDRHEIAAGQSRYQIVQQPMFKSKSKILNDRRGDLMLLINGMPLIHIELKRSGVSVSQAYHQIEKYSHEGIFSGLFSLVQVFVAMEPEEAVYFANPGPDGKFNKDFYFHWADFNNEPINHWSKIASSILSIPMAHQLIGFYTVPDDADGVLKVMRSYQYYAANAISDKVAKTDWNSKHALGGFIWHTTGSGKTMTSFKSAQLIANSKDADKVVFLMDRIELGTQSWEEYNAFSDGNEEVQQTENTVDLISKLKSSDPANTLIVTSIQKMSNINDDNGLSTHDLDLINDKRIVFVVDEAHRSTFGDMMIIIKETFTSAIFFGFTGTPIHEENQRKKNTTSTVFGDELHRYSIADGIRDKNVLGFDPYKVLTHKDRDLRIAVALEKAKAKSESEALADPKKKKVFLKYMTEVKMAGFKDGSGNYTSGIEDSIPPSQYHRSVHCQKVLEDITDNWLILSQAGKFHAVFATSSIPEAIEYYRLLKDSKPELKTTALFDPNIDNNGGFAFKEDGLVEIMTDYNERYGLDFNLAGHSSFKKDIQNRLAHKEQYKRIENDPDLQLDILIVVDQMLTGYDSKWINTLYMDKVLKYENIIQAFSRTNRLFGPDKPHGTIRYYRYPHTMERNIDAAIKLYSGDKPIGLFVDHLDSNLNSMNHIFSEIKNLFISAGVEDFSQLPDDLSERGRFAKLFKDFNSYLEAAKIQGFSWKQQMYEFETDDSAIQVDLNFDENIYLILALRYKELFSGDGDFGGGSDSVPFEIDGHLTEIDTGKIDADYMNSRFDKFLRALKNKNIGEAEQQAILDELHKSFASLSQEEQKYANIFLHAVQHGEVNLESGKSFRDYVTEYQSTAKKDQIFKVSEIFGLNEAKLREMIDSGVTEHNLNEYGRFDKLKDTVDKEKAKKFIDKLEGANIPQRRVNMKVQTLLKKFIIEGRFEVSEEVTL